MKNSRSWLWWAFGAVLVPFTVFAADLVIPHVFSAGGAIVANEMNENFAAVKAAMDTKEGGGTRLKRVVLKSADGATMAFFGLLFAQSPIYDTQLAAYCGATQSDDGKLRCLPTVRSSSQSGYAFGSAVGIQEYFTDAGCTVPIRLGQAPNSGGISYPGFPPETVKYAVEYTSAGVVVHQLGSSYSGPLYFGTPSSCLTQPGTYYSVGAVVPPSTFAEVTPTLL